MLPADDKSEPRSGPEGAGPIRKYNVADLLQDRREAILVHNGSEYHLRITANGRLILTK